MSAGDLLGLIVDAIPGVARVLLIGFLLAGLVALVVWVLATWEDEEP
jgi:hypothetical protein